MTFRLSSMIAFVIFTQAVLCFGCAEVSDLEREKAIYETHMSNNYIYAYLVDDEPLNWNGEPSEFFSKDKVAALIKAIATEDISEIKNALHAGAEINAKGKYGITPLLWALCMEKKKAFRTLLENGADPKLSTELGYPVAFYAALCTNDSYWLKTLLEKGLDPNLERKLDPKYSDFLVPVESTIIYAAIASYSTHNVKLLIDAGADIDKPAKIHDDFGNTTPLLHATNENSYDIVYLLLEEGADYKVQDDIGVDLAQRSVEARLDLDSKLGKWRLRVIDFLLKKGVDIEEAKQKVYNRYKHNKFFIESREDDPVMGPWLRKNHNR